ncbi:autotransporter assembly complex protein TamA [Arenimonas terrae]|uniref:Translocation and assembly module subunit TamA n=1 Tax=Arenimonas terrae TaxID=2546226 RepID=A0A5C4RN95_9GAMM|nr:autotransporter assembly complex family protein [Arenimonas terrae]TNJ32723.1 outer membrane protein assembly factor [Arenimonas terrae]
MPISPPARLLLVAALLLSAPAAWALELQAVEIRGLDDEEMRDNVSDALSLQRLNPNRRKSLSESRLSYLLRRAPREARAALEPFGYYDPEIRTEVQREGEQVTVQVTIAPGEPVRVRRRDLSLTGPAEADSALMRRLERFRPRAEQPFHHGTYEDSKAAMDRALAERGYFDAEQAVHRVTVSRAERAADIELAWTSGERYRLGNASFKGHQFRPGLLEKLVPWTPGQAYDQKELLALQKSLSELDYFSAIDITADPKAADAERRMPVKVALAPGKRSIYSAGVRYGTDTGLGLTFGLERRWVNNRGHKLRSLASLAQRRSDVTVQYRIPAFAWLDGWYTASASAREEEIDGINNQLFELVGSRSGRLGKWNLTAAMNFRRERFEDAETGFDYAYSTLVYPSLWAQWSEADDLLYPRRALGLTLELRGGNTALGSDIDFLQMRAEGRWIRGFGRRNRLLLRAEAGTTISGEFPDFPPSLRFYAGGDRSVRGYGYKEIGQYIEDPTGRRYVFGGKHLAVFSAEFERMFTREWGGAVFVDAGDAFDETFEAEVGVGVGLRWRSPVGPVRLDVAHGFGDAAQQSVRLHLNIGPDL